MVHVLEGLLYKFFFFKLLRLLPDTHPADPVQKKKKKTFLNLILYVLVLFKCTEFFWLNARRLKAKKNFA